MQPLDCEYKRQCIICLAGVLPDEVVRGLKEAGVKDVEAGDRWVRHGLGVTVTRTIHCCKIQQVVPGTALIFCSRVDGPAVYEIQQIPDLLLSPSLCCFYLPCERNAKCKKRLCRQMDKWASWVEGSSRVSANRTVLSCHCVRTVCARYGGTRHQPPRRSRKIRLGWAFAIGACFDVKLDQEGAKGRTFTIGTEAEVFPVSCPSYLLFWPFVNALFIFSLSLSSLSSLSYQSN